MHLPLQEMTTQWPLMGLRGQMALPLWTPLITTCSQ